MNRLESLSNSSTELTFRQRWASYLTIVVFLIGLANGIFQRSLALSATLPFENREVGIAGRFPRGWLVFEPTNTVIFHAQDPAALPFKTAILITVLPTTSQAQPSDILNVLTINRANQFATYRHLGNANITLSNSVEGRQMNYAYTAVEVNPFLESEPIVVHATDVVVLRGNQAIVITFEADAQTFDRYKPLFDEFLASLSI